MKSSAIRLLPIETPAPRIGYIPFKHARYWRSDIELSNPRQAGTAVFMTQKAYVRANVHANSDLDNEVGGWLVGSWREDQITGKEYIVVERCLPAVYARRGSAYLTFTQDCQVAMFETMEEKYPDKELVGWYHTHFFPHPWQVALVIEPHTNVAGFFVRDGDGNLDGRHYFGFHELANEQKRSVVHWINMKEEFTELLGMKENENE